MTTVQGNVNQVLDAQFRNFQGDSSLEQSVHTFYKIDPREVMKKSSIESNMYRLIQIVAAVAFIIFASALVAIPAIFAPASVPVAFIGVAFITHAFYQNIYKPLEEKCEEHGLEAQKNKDLLQRMDQLIRLSPDELQTRFQMAQLEEPSKEAKQLFKRINPSNPEHPRIMALAAYEMTYEKAMIWQRIIDNSSAQVRQLFDKKLSTNDPQILMQLNKQLVEKTVISNQFIELSPENLLASKVQCAIFAHMISHPEKASELPFNILALPAATRLRLGEIHRYDDNGILSDEFQNVEGPIISSYATNINNETVLTRADALRLHPNAVGKRLYQTA